MKEMDVAAYLFISGPAVNSPLRGTGQRAGGMLSRLRVRNRSSLIAMYIAACVREIEFTRRNLRVHGAMYPILVDVRLGRPRRRTC
ncbi:unnamed protein product [Leptosia nina]|uniref:Uncharacterized protein n=1 Tax=Leptosia nina TaxID=320188 RepID=A0AAV1J7F9_9NEOP